MREVNAFASTLSRVYDSPLEIAAFHQISRELRVAQAKGTHCT